MKQKFLVHRCIVASDCKLDKSEKVLQQGISFGSVIQFGSLPYLHSLECDGDAVLGDGPDLAQGVRRRPDGNFTNLEIHN